jgi:hypothetical protein
MRHTNKIGWVTVLLIATTGASMAQSIDPPARAARLNYLSGQVSFRPDAVEDWAAASLNYPLTTGDHLWTDPGAQTEMHVGSTAIRMGPETALAFLNLDDRAVQLSLTAGSLNVHILAMRPDETFEVDTPNAAVSLRPGDYRINVDGDRNATWAIANAGEADIAGGGAGFPVYPRQMAQLTGSDTLSQEITPVPAPDGFDAWCRERQSREESVVSARYVPRDMTGYEDLDAYGVWRNVPPYGWVWMPTSAPAGWAPYREGRWAWVDPWGWTWIDDEPWGFAPFHYGRWAFAGGAWVWAPGRLDAPVRPVYAPALVAFIGGPGFGVEAWFPLAPGEVYRPAYQVSAVYVRQMNIAQVSDVTVIDRVNVENVRYANQAVPGAVVAVPRDAFVSARPVAAAAVRMDAREAAAAPVIGMTAAVAPQRESVLAGPRRTSAPPARFAERKVVMKSTPPPPQRALDAAPAARNDRPAVRLDEEHRPAPPAAKAAEERKSEAPRNEKKANKKATRK